MTQSLALGTLNYAIECVLNGEKALSCDVIEESDFSPVQKTYIQKAINETGEKIAPGRELSRFENCLMSVLQPATYEFLQNTDLVAGVHLFLPMSHFYRVLHEVSGSLQEVDALSIEKKPAEVLQSYLRQELADKVYISVGDITRYLELLRHPETQESLQLHEFFALAPKFTCLVLPNSTVNFEFIGQALEKCPNTKFKTVSYHSIMDDEMIQSILTLPHLSELNLRGHYSSLHLLAGSKLKTVGVQFLNGSPKDEHFQIFARMSHLETLKLGWTYITPDGIRALLTAAPQIKVVQISFALEEQGAAIEKLLQDFPQVDFQDTSNKSFRKS